MDPVPKDAFDSPSNSFKRRVLSVDSVGGNITVHITFSLEFKTDNKTIIESK